jgi:hypothetical protein
MKVTRTSVGLFLLSLALFAACYFFGQKSIQYDLDIARLELEERCKDVEPCFGFSDGPPPDVNYWDVSSWTCLVFGSAAAVAGIWLAQSRR